ncbi:hypothetical protein AVEN_188096-1 [Araneus ventricosus]|uniref:Uncharacterized protein n=1 Tax=Araneus ventricosus TaxID=182803 RepID=A0A4Y2KBW0_ARAVE|nr:hypothetical protein AVEN_188096-1 [Araneus ventricosus]
MDEPSLPPSLFTDRGANEEVPVEAKRKEGRRRGGGVFFVPLFSPNCSNAPVTKINNVPPELISSRLDNAKEIAFSASGTIEQPLPALQNRPAIGRVSGFDCFHRRRILNKMKGKCLRKK